MHALTAEQQAHVDGLPLGAEVPPFDRGELHSTAELEDGSGTLALYSTASGRTAARTNDGQPQYVD